MIARETVERIAVLAKLKFSDSEIDEFVQQFDKILQYVGEIEKLDLTGVEPLAHISPSINVFREDVPHQSLSREEALQNAPKRNESFFKVPKVLGG